MRITKSKILALCLILLFARYRSLAQCVNSFPYVEDFETSAAWTAVSIANGDWAWGAPNHTYVINSAGSGSKCWCVGNLTGAFYNFWEQSYVQSPCFDFTNLKYPHIKFKLFYECEYHFDGGNLQYSTDGGTTWKNVGAYNDPNDCNTKNWYNYANINYLNNPAWIPVKEGWCGNTQVGGVGWDPTNPTVSCVGGNGQGHWLTAEHCLDSLAGQPNVILRFTFGAGYTCNDFDGFAFDSVAISDGIPNLAAFTHSCTGPNTINFSNGSPACPTNTWAWDFGDPASGSNNIANTQNPSHTFSAPGSYTVTLITSGGDCNAPDTSAQVVHIMSASITSFTNVSCNGGANGSANVAATSGTSPFTYIWSPVGGNSSTATNLAAGNYTVTVSDAVSCPVTATVTITEPSAITLTVSATPAGCGQSNGSATVTANGGTGAFTYNWTPGNVSGNTISNLGTGTYTVTVHDANNCSATATASIVQPSPFTITITTTPATCFGGTDGSLSANVIGGTTPYTYQWSNGGTNSSVDSLLAAGTYTLYVYDANGCRDSTTMNVSEPTPVVAAASGQTVCNGQSATLLATASGGNGAPYTYTWNTGGSGSSISVNTPFATTYSVIAYDVKGCPSFPDTAMVNVLPPLGLVVTSNDTTCPGQQAVLTAAASGGNGNYSITWLPSNTGGNSLNVHPNVTTTYTAIVSDGCTVKPDTATGTVVVFQNPVINFNANPASGCEPVCATFAGVSTSVNGNNISSYSWDFGDGSSGSGINASHCYTNSGTYNVLLSGITQKGCRDSITKNNLIIVFPNPKADFTASAYETDEYDNTINFYDASYNNIASWQWNFGDGSGSTAQNPFHNFAPAGNYLVDLLVINTNGCRDSITKEIVVKPVFTFYAPNAFSPDGDGINEVFLPLGTAWDPQTFNLWVFDRWGNQIFHTTDAYMGWDGVKHGQLLQEDVYVWEVKLNDVMGTTHQYSGQVSIVR